MTPAARRVLEIMAECSVVDEEYEPEIVVEGRGCWLGMQRIAYRTFEQLLLCVAIKDVSDVKGSVQRYAINDTGKAIYRRPALEDEVRRALRTGGSFTIRDDHLIPMNEGAEP